MNENEKKQTNSKTLSLRGSGGSSVRMNLSHGRSKSVLIETKRKKIIHRKTKKKIMILN